VIKTFERPLNKIFSLEIDSEPEEIQVNFIDMAEYIKEIGIDSESDEEVITMKPMTKKDMAEEHEKSEKQARKWAEETKAEFRAAREKREKIKETTRQQAKQQSNRHNSTPQHGARNNSSHRFCPWPRQQWQRNQRHRNHNSIDPQHGSFVSRVPEMDAQLSPDAPLFWRPLGSESGLPPDALCITVKEAIPGPKQYIEKELCVRRNAHLGFDGPLRIRFLDATEDQSTSAADP
jgi:hypothetical protein